MTSHPGDVISCLYGRVSDKTPGYLMTSSLEAFCQARPSLNNRSCTFAPQTCLALLPSHLKNLSYLPSPSGSDMWHWGFKPLVLHANWLSLTTELACQLVGHAARNRVRRLQHDLTTTINGSDRNKQDIQRNTGQWQQHRNANNGIRKLHLVWCGPLILVSLTNVCLLFEQIPKEISLF